MAEKIIDQMDADILGGVSEKVVGAATSADKASNDASKSSDTSSGVENITKVADGDGKPITSVLPPDKKVEGDKKAEDTKKPNILKDLESVLEGGVVPVKKAEVKPDQNQQQKPEDNVQGKENFVDLSEFGDTQKKWLTRMPGDARVYFAELIRTDKANNDKLKTQEKTIEELKKGVVTVPENYNEHPEAFRLTPEFRQYTSDLGLARGIYDHWIKQKQLVDAGKDWQDTVDEVDQKTGQVKVFVKDGAMAADEQAKIYIEENLALARQQYRDMEARLGNLQQNHLNQHKIYVDSIKDLSKKYYPQFEDEKYEGRAILSTIEKELQENKIVSKTNPVFDVLARALSMNYIYADYIKKKLGAVTQAAERKAEAIKAGPNNSNIGGGGSVGNNGAGGSTSNKNVIKDLDRLLA